MISILKYLKRTAKGQSSIWTYDWGTG